MVDRESQIGRQKPRKLRGRKLIGLLAPNSGQMVGAISSSRAPRVHLDKTTKATAMLVKQMMARTGRGLSPRIPVARARAAPVVCAFSKG